jgi:hypothetical protein
LQALFEAQRIQDTSFLNLNNPRQTTSNVIESEKEIDMDIFDKELINFFDELINERQINDKDQSAKIITDKKKQDNNSRKYLQIVKANMQSQKCYLNNTSEIIKNLIHDSILLQSTKKNEINGAKFNCISPKKAFNKVAKQSSNMSSSVMLFRSINNSHTICVEPTDVLEPLNDGEFNEYKLFPTNKQIYKGNRNSQVNSEIDLDILLSDYTPRSLSLSCSNGSSLSSSMTNSPNNFSIFS